MLGLKRRNAVVRWTNKLLSGGEIIHSGGNVLPFAYLAGAILRAPAEKREITPLLPHIANACVKINTLVSRAP